MPSEFGHYEAQHKYINEFEKTEKRRATKMINNRNIIKSSGRRIQSQFRSSSQKII